jgi:hypothetical protein
VFFDEFCADIAFCSAAGPAFHFDDRIANLTKGGGQIEGLSWLTGQRWLHHETAGQYAASDAKAIPREPTKFFQ